MVEDTLWVMGGGDENYYPQKWTQVVRQGQPTQWGPNLTEIGAGHCATTLQDNSVILTGGQTRSNFSGSARTEIYNSTTKRWERKADMRQRRYGHSCTNVWLDPDPSIQSGVIAPFLRDTSVLSVVVAGGKMILYFTAHSFYATGYYFDEEAKVNPVHSVEVYLPWNYTWLELAPLPLLKDKVHRMDNTRIFSLNENGGLALYLLGGESTLDITMGYISNAVWRPDWFSANQSYHWTEDDELDPPMGELHH